MKDKNIAAVLAFFLGTFGVHRFYLGQTWLGVLYCIFAMTGISAILGFIDAVAFFAMSEERFDVKYNWKELYADRYAREGSYRSNMSEYERRRVVKEGRRQDRFEQQRKSRERDIENWQRRHRHREQEEEKVRKEQERTENRMRRRAQIEKVTLLKTQGVERFKDYDYEGAIESFNKILEIDDKDVATHFNLACTHSLNEDVNEAFYHLDQAVVNGFDDFNKIKTHDALAFLRIQPAYEAFEDNKFRLLSSTEAPVEIPIQEEKPIVKNEPLELGSPQPDLLQTQPDLLDQLQKLGELKEKGVLTEEEFRKEKRKLLS